MAMAAASSRRFGTACILVFVVVVLAAAGGASAKTIQVGGSANWTLPTEANTDYTTWAGSQTFNFGDELVFNYDPAAHNVFLVNATAYDACDDTDQPDQKWESGQDVVALTMADREDYYFICGIPGHCSQLQKFHINVPALAASPPAGSAAPAAGVPDTDSAPDCLPRRGVLILSVALVFLTHLVM